MYKSTSRIFAAAAGLSFLAFPMWADEGSIDFEEEDSLSEVIDVGYQDGDLQNEDLMGINQLSDSEIDYLISLVEGNTDPNFEWDESQLECRNGLANRFNDEELVGYSELNDSRKFSKRRQVQRAPIQDQKRTYAVLETPKKYYKPGKMTAAQSQKKASVVQNVPQIIRKGGQQVNGAPWLAQRKEAPRQQVNEPCDVEDSSYEVCESEPSENVQASEMDDSSYEVCESEPAPSQKPSQKIAQPREMQDSRRMAKAAPRQQVYESYEMDDDSAYYEVCESEPAPSERPSQRIAQSREKQASPKRMAKAAPRQQVYEESEMDDVCEAEPALSQRPSQRIAQSREMEESSRSKRGLQMKMAQRQKPSQRIAQPREMEESPRKIAKAAPRQKIYEPRESDDSDEVCESAPVQRQRKVQPREMQGSPRKMAKAAPRQKIYEPRETDDSDEVCESAPVQRQRRVQPREMQVAPKKIAKAAPRQKIREPLEMDDSLDEVCESAPVKRQRKVQREIEEAPKFKLASSIVDLVGTAVRNSKLYQIITQPRVIDDSLDEVCESEAPQRQIKVQPRKMERSPKKVAKAVKRKKIVAQPEMEESDEICESAPVQRQKNVQPREMQDSRKKKQASQLKAAQRQKILELLEMNVSDDQEDESLSQNEEMAPQKIPYSKSLSQREGNSPSYRGSMDEMPVCDFADCCNDCNLNCMFCPWYGFDVTGEVLFWGTNYNIPFSTTIQNFSSNTNASNPLLRYEFNTENASVMRAKNKWSPGFRIGIGGSPNYDNIDLQLIGTYYQNHVINSLPFNPTTEPASTFALAPSDPPAAILTGKANLQLLYQFADFELGKSYYACSTVLLRPFCGVRGGWLSQDHRLSYPSITTAGASGVFVTQPTNKSSYFDLDVWCVGPRIGLNSSWFKAMGFSLMANFSSSLLYGKAHQKFTTIANDLTVTTNDDVVLFFTEAETTEVIRDRFWSVFPTLQLLMGASWEAGTACDWNFKAYAAWETNFWWEVSNIEGFVEKALSMQGLTAGLSYGF